MALSPKRTVLLYLTLAGLALVLLAGSLPRLDLQPGLPVPGGVLDGSAGSGDPARQPGVTPLPGYVPSLLRGALAAGFWLAVGYLAVLVVRRVGIRRLALVAGLALGILGLLQLLPAIHPSASPAGGEEEPMAEAAPAFEYATSPLGTPPTWLIGLVIGGLGVAGVVLAVQLIRPKAGVSTKPDPVAQAAETALQELGSGRDLEDVILTCYARMSQALAEGEGIERGAAMTAREFERSLAKRGVPHEAVSQLTRLFESVRYGHTRPQKRDEQVALDCLTSVVDFCRRTSGAGHES